MQSSVLRNLRMELKRAILNPWFVFPLVVGLALAAVVAYQLIPGNLDSIKLYVLAHETQVIFPSPFSCYTNNLLTDYSAQATRLFFILAPFLLTVPHCWSYANDLKSGYVFQVIGRVGRDCYFVSKYAAVFVSSGLVVSLPLMFSFALTACFLPGYPPDVYEMSLASIDSSCILGDLFYADALAYMILRILLDFLFAGLWGSFVLSLSMLMRNRVALLTVPYLGQLVLKEGIERIYIALRVHGPSVSLLDQLKARPDSFYNWHWVTTVEMLFLAVISVTVSLAMRRRDLL